MAFTLSKCSKTVTLLKQAFPTLEANIKSKVGSGEQSSEKRRMTEDFLKRTPERMETHWNSGHSEKISFCARTEVSSWSFDRNVTFDLM